MPQISEAVTRDIRVRVHARYVPQRSLPDEGLWFFAYQVTVENLGGDVVQLVSRHWVITDGEGRVKEVEGDGVVGEQPVLEPGSSFQYTSACPLPTQFGTMHGSYCMVAADGERFDAEIAPFSLNLPDALH